MKPILFHLFGEAVPAYTVFMIGGYALALLVIALGIRRGPAGLDRAQAVDLFIVMVVSSLLGSKVAHVLFEAPGHVDEHGKPIGSLLELLRADPWHWARLGEGGFVWYGGLIAALGTAIVYFRRRPALDAWAYADLFAPAIMAGLAIGRIGCFFAGCCHGQPTDGPLGVRLPGLPGPVHPTQLYESTYAFLLFFGLWWRAPRRRFSGELVPLMLMAYAVLRTLNEVLRGDADRGVYGPISTSQLLSIPLFLAGLALYVRGLRRAAPRPAPGEPYGTIPS